MLPITLQVQFDPMEMTEDRLQYFYDSIRESLKSTEVLAENDHLELRSNQGSILPELPPDWPLVLDSFFDTFGLTEARSVSLSYLNEIPLQDLQDFRNYLNISIEMPASLKEKFEFFRSEFTYKYPFGEIRVWIQPDWDDHTESYCVRLNLESRHPESFSRERLISKLQEMCDGVKDIFGQILSREYICSIVQ